MYRMDVPVTKKWFSKDHPWRERDAKSYPERMRGHHVLGQSTGNGAYAQACSQSGTGNFSTSSATRLGSSPTRSGRLWSSVKASYCHSAWRASKHAVWSARCVPGVKRLICAREPGWSGAWNGLGLGSVRALDGKSIERYFLVPVGSVSFRFVQLYT